MQSIAPSIHAGFQKVHTSNTFPEKSTVWFDFVDGYNKNENIGEEKHLFTLTNETGASKSSSS